MLVRLLQRFSVIRLRQDAHPAAVPPPGVERSPYAVDGCERVWMRSHLTAFARVSLRLVTPCDADRDAMVHRMGCGSRWRRQRKSEVMWLSTRFYARMYTSSTLDDGICNAS